MVHFSTMLTTKGKAGKGKTKRREKEIQKEGKTQQEEIQKERKTNRRGKAEH